MKQAIIWERVNALDSAIEDFHNDFFLNPLDPKIVFNYLCPVCKKQIFPLVLTASQGERRIEYPAKNIRDFFFFGCEHSTFDDFANHIKEVLQKTDAENFSIPGLLKHQAEGLQKALTTGLKEYITSINLSAIAPIVVKSELINKKEKNQQLQKLLQHGLVLERIVKSLPKDIRSLHEKRWGENRNTEFFDYLEEMIKMPFCECIRLVTKLGDTAALQINIVSSDTYHYYYSIYNPEYLGAGTAVQNESFLHFIRSPKLQYYSYGRGAERYKYRRANNATLFYEVKGFYLPLGQIT